MISLERVFIVLAGLYGASGVGLAAAAAHLAPGSSLDSAALMALVHAPAMLATLAAIHSGVLNRRFGLIGLAGFALGVALFSGDITIRVFAGHPLFPMAAPSGGMILIGAWLLLALSGFVARPLR